MRTVAIGVRAVGQRARPGNEILHDVSLTVNRGELVAITGNGGSGKTALLDTMSGLRAPCSGSVHRAPGNIGYVPRGDAIHPALPLARTLRYAALLHDVAGQEAAVSDVLRVLDLAGRSAMPAGDLSGGERKRASIAAELVTSPGLFFLDEPTAGLDPARGAELFRFLRRLCDDGTTVVLTTRNSLDADRCDKIAVLANGGYLAFFGTPAAARDYFGADSLDEIYERLAGLGDPVKAWSRRFFPFPRTNGGASLTPALPSQPRPALLLPGTAGPLSVGQAGKDLGGPGRDDAVRDDPGPDDPRLGAPGRDVSDLDGPRLGAPGWDVSDLDGRPGPNGFRLDSPGLTGPGPDGSGRNGLGLDGHVAARRTVDLVGAPESGLTRRAFRALRQLAVLTRRNADILARSRLTRAVLAGSPVAVLLISLVLFRPGAFDPAHPDPAATEMILFWVAFGGFFFGLAYGLPQICAEFPVLHRERFAGLSAIAYVLAKAAALVPVLAVADVLFLVVLRGLGLLPVGGDYPAAFVTLLLCSVAALGLGLLISAAVSKPSQATVAMTVVCVPQVLFVGAILPVPAMALIGRWISYAMTNRWTFEALGHSLGVRELRADGKSPLGAPLLASYGATFDRAVGVDWLILAGFTAAFFAATITLVVRKTRTRAASRQTPPRLRDPNPATATATAGEPPPVRRFRPVCASAAVATAAPAVHPCRPSAASARPSLPPRPSVPPRPPHCSACRNRIDRRLGIHHYRLVYTITIFVPALYWYGYGRDGYLVYQVVSLYTKSSAGTEPEPRAGRECLAESGDYPPRGSRELNDRSGDVRRCFPGFSVDGKAGRGGQTLQR